MTDVARTLFVVHQVGAEADGGLKSVGELFAHVPLGNPTIITNRESAYSRAWERFGRVRVTRMSADSSGWPQRLLRLAVNNVRVLIEVRRRGISVVHVNDHRAFWDSAFGAKIAGAALLFNVRDSMREGASVRRWRTYLRICDRFLVLSEEMQAQWKDALAPLSDRQLDKFTFVYSVVDPDRFSPVSGSARAALRADLDLAPDQRVLVYVGRFDPKKGQLGFIEHALPAIARVFPDLVVYFVGDFRPESEPYAATCATALDRLKLSGAARFVGYREAMADWYRIADLVVLASEREGLARSMIEGLSCGTPVVSFDVCSAREVLEANDCGVVVGQGDYEAFARDTASLLGDEERRCAYAKTGARVGRRLFDPGSCAAAYEAIVRELGT